MQYPHLVQINYRKVRSEHLLLLLLACATAGLGVYGSTLGLGSHDDSRAIVERSISAILQGSYQPSRSLGYPLYEAIAALLYWMTGSLRTINLYSLVLSEPVIQYSSAAIASYNGYPRLLLGWYEP